MPPQVIALLIASLTARLSKLSGFTERQVTGWVARQLVIRECWGKPLEDLARLKILADEIKYREV